MINIELSKEYFKEKALASHGQKSMLQLYVDFVHKHILKPLGFDGYRSSDAEKLYVKIDGRKVLIDVFRNERLAVYDLLSHVYPHCFVISFQRKSLMGIADIQTVINSLKYHKAVMSINENQYFCF